MAKTKQHVPDNIIRERLGLFSVELTEMRPFRDDTGSGSRCVKTGDRQGIVIVEIDRHALSSYAKKALANKNGISRAMNGAIRFHAVKASIINTPTKAAETSTRD
jgi:hypothetical protein